MITSRVQAQNGISAGDQRSVGLSHFQARRYEEAIEALRKYLRKYPRDLGMWNLLGVAYYHTGQPRKGLRYLKHVEKKTTEKSYNYYYQGLCFIASDQPNQAREYFAFIASHYQDEYAGRSTFELAVLEYKLRNAPRANYWLTRYLQLYPNGIYTGLATTMIQSLRDFRWLEGVEGASAPNQEEALFKYNKLSLGPKPHYWFLQAGGFFSERSTYQPSQKGLELKTNTPMALQIIGGIGIGPTKLGNVTSYAGYTYRQDWNTDNDRLGEYFGDPMDLQYIPFRSDLLERTHQFYADLRRQIHPLIFVGLFTRLDVKRAGSSLLPSVDNDSLNRVTNISSTQLMIPWIGYSYHPNIRSLLYFYWRKELNDSTPEVSNKTYELGLNGQEPIISLGLTNEWDLPDYQVNLGLDVFQYEFIFNDPWLDYTRLGFIANAQHEFLPRWYVQGIFGYYQDSYQIPRIRTGACDSNKSVSLNSNTPPVVCQRQDTGLMLSGTLYWNYTQFHRFSFQVEQVQNQNPTQKEFVSTKRSFKGSFSMAFPSVKRTIRYVDRFADSAFTKEND